RRLNLTSAMVVPLIAREKVLGAMTLLYSDSGRHYGNSDLVAAEDVARRAATAIDNARLFAAEQQARQAAEAAEARLRALSGASRALASSLALSAALGEVARLATR